MNLSFPDLDSAINAARDAGFSIGAPHRNEPIGLMHGSFHIAKWRNLLRCDRKLCHGVIHQNYFPGEVTVLIQPTCPKEPAAALCTAATATNPEKVA